MNSSSSLFRETDSMQHRQDDQQSIKITREVPLWSLLTGLALVAAQAGLLYSNQLHQADTLRDQADSIKGFTLQIENLSKQISDANLKVAGYEFRITSLETRLSNVEALHRR